MYLELEAAHGMEFIIYSISEQCYIDRYCLYICKVIGVDRKEQCHESTGNNGNDKKT